MRAAGRRLTFQLVSLFDLLIIIVFAQYFDLQARTADELRSAEAQAADEARELARLRGEVSRQEEESREQRGLQQQLAEEREQIQRLANLVGHVFDVAEPDLARLLSPRTPDEQKRVRTEIDKLRATGGAAALRQVLTLAELEKRCDLWQVSIDEQGAFELLAAGRTARFRADSPERFSAELFRQYRMLPEPKSLVVIVLSWDDATLRSRTIAITGLEQTVDRLRDDVGRRTRFESAVLGYLPRRVPAETSGSK